MTDEPLHSIPFHSSSSSQGSPPLDFQPDNCDGLFILSNITLSAATDIAGQDTRCSVRTMTDAYTERAQRIRQTLTVRLVGLGDRGRRRREEDGQPDELLRRRQGQGAPSSSHCAPRGARRGSAESVQAETPTRVRRRSPPPLSHGFMGDTGLAVGKYGLSKIRRRRKRRGTEMERNRRHWSSESVAKPLL